MVINWYGEGCFRIQSGDFVMIVDPFPNTVGLTPPRGKTDVVLRTMTPLPLAYTPASDRREIAGPGEYEVRGAEISGWPLTKETNATVWKTVFLAVVEDMRLGFLGHMSEAGEGLLDKLGGVDLLFIPGGGAPHLAQEGAAKLTKQINPKIVIPSFFKIPGLKRKAGDVKGFLEELGRESSPAQEKFTLKKKDLPAATRAVVLKI